MNLSAVNVKLQGYTPAFRDAEISLVNQATGVALTRKPFLDGSLLVRDMQPGMYDLVVRHPNLITPIEQRPIRIFPQRIPTLIPILVRDDLFRDTPIRDVPDADLGPVMQSVNGLAGRLAPVGGKASGEVIRSADWNALVEVVGDLTRAVAQLLPMISPRGHDHPEIAEKIDEVQGNIRRFSESFGRSLLELRREIETGILRRDVTEVLDVAAATPAIRDRVLGRLAELELRSQDPTPAYTTQLANFGGLMLGEVNTLAQEQGQGADDFMRNPAVLAVLGSAGQYAQAGPQTRPEAELQTYQRTGSIVNGSKIARLLGDARVG